MIKKILFIILIIIISHSIYAQELNATVIINTAQLGTNVDQSIFQNLQKQLTDFLNNRKWTNDNFQSTERINCNFTLTLASISTQNQYQGQLIVQAARPVYNSSYQSPLVNYQDQQFVFKYQSGQQLNFNPNQISGADPLIANLTAIFAFYVNIILGMDYDSYKLNGGKQFYTSAINIVNGAPQNSAIKGWQTFDGQRSRYWLATNLNDIKLNGMHNVFYKYFRRGLDSLYDADLPARQNALNALNDLQSINQSNPNTMIEQFFVENRNAEFIGLFKQSSPDVRSQALQILVQLDPQSTDQYNSALK